MSLVVAVVQGRELVIIRISFSLSVTNAIVFCGVVVIPPVGPVPT